MRVKGIIVCFFLSVFFFTKADNSFAQLNDGASNTIKSISVLEDVNGELDAVTAFSKTFVPESNMVPNFGLTNSVYWIKLDLANNDHIEDYLLKIHNGILKSVILYEPVGNGFRVQYAGDSIAYSQKFFKTQFPVFRLDIPENTTKTVLLRVSSLNVMELPVMAGHEMTVQESLSRDQLYFGIYLGIVCVMFFYNIFIFFTVRDKNYLYYVMYIATVGLVQACLKGYAARYFWPENAWLTYQMTNISLALSGIFSIIFVINFLNVKTNRPNLYKLLMVLQVSYFVGIAINLSGNFVIAQQTLQGIASLVSISLMTVGISIYRKGYKPALFFSISWSFFLAGVVIYIMKDAGVLPYNNFTSNAILIGSALEVALLSFALADKINTYRKEKEESQANELRAVQANEMLVREQNVILEKKVDERTLELKLSNDGLTKALTDLKEAETQLVEKEKMASLGQLTAGIAHEINNPINFVTSNVKPLNRDVLILLDTIEDFAKIAIDDSPAPEKLKKIEEYKNEIDYSYLKIEIDQLLSGISEGASRTAEIVKGLRIFSRLDEDDIKKANINEGLESTLIITNNLLNNTIRVDRNFQELPLIECYPGKLNQVFLNIISNGVYAIRKKFQDSEGGVITISTSSDENNIFITISDNGTGMDELTKKRLYEPFFTTKDVGEGTGLGMSIAYNTINKHNGQININSELGKGTDFIIKLPLIQK
jgi:two-component system, NtrC family, sensor kinase